MNTIVMNTLTGAVSEYTNFTFDSITPTKAGSSAGLFTFGGNLDVLAPIVSVVRTGKKIWGTTMIKYLGMIFFAIKGSGVSTSIVVGETASYQYNFPIEPGGESRSKPGRGIRESYLAFGYSNTDGADFQLDQIEVELVKSTTRRTQ